MTITPIPVLPPATRGAGARADAKGGPADDFAAVLDGQLNGRLDGAKTLPHKPSDPKRHAGSTDAASGEGQSGDAQFGGAQPGGAQPGAVPPGGLAVVPAEAPPGGLPPTGPAAATAPTAPTAAEVAVPVAPQRAGGTGSAAAMATPTDPTADPASPHQPAAPTGLAPAQQGAPVDAATDPARGSAAPVAPTAPAPLPDLPAAVIVTKAPGVKATTAAVASDKPEAPSAASAAGVAAPAAPATPATDTPAGGASHAVAPSPVLAQVTPALARVVTRGDGEHRMMLKLHPADLGEIHLTVTVRGEHVDVEIAAGAQARDVLRDGSAHLRSLLESIGRSTGQLVLRDLPATPVQLTGPGGSLGQDGGAGTSYADTGAGRRDQPDSRGGHRQPPAADQPLDRPPLTQRASGRTTVPGASALDVTV